jgi:AcrR family transcriptional regulator
LVAYNLSMPRVNDVDRRNIPDMPVTPRPSYHHGDLQRAIISTAVALMAERGDWQFTFREIARRIGVSHAAPYNHFPSKEALLDQLTILGFERLREQLCDARAAAETPQEQLRSMAGAYVAFGCANAVLYRLMFSTETSRSPDLHSSDRAMAVFSITLDVLQGGHDAGQFHLRPATDQAAACWAMVHGLTLLAIDGLLIPEKVGAEPLTAALDVLMQGLAIPSAADLAQ